MTIIAFYVGKFMLPNGDLFYGNLNLFDLISIPLCSIGVFIYNWFPEKPVKISI